MYKHTYEHVKSIIELEKGYHLLSKTYKICNEKLEIECDKGHVFHMSYDCFNRRHERCPVCYKEKRYLSYEYVKNKIESVEGYKLLSTEYKNAHGKLHIKCNKGHDYYVSYCGFYNGHRCSICSGKLKLEYEYVKKYIESFGYELLSTEYNGNKSKIELKCNKGHIIKMKFNNFQQGDRCMKCWQSQSYSKPEKEILDYVKSVYNGIIIANDKTQIMNPETGHHLELDIWLPDLNKAIEYNGEYWHKKPKKIILDNLKQNICIERGIKLLVIKESEWLKNKNYEVVNNFIFQ